MDELFAGFNVSLFAYGQTGSGKTHTMFGSAVANEPGLIELLLSAVHKRSVRANPSVLSLRDWRGHFHHSTPLQFHLLSDSMLFCVLGGGGDDDDDDVALVAQAGFQ